MSDSSDLESTDDDRPRPARGPSKPAFGGGKKAGAPARKPAGATKMQFSSDSESSFGSDLPIMNARDPTAAGGKPPPRVMAREADSSSEASDVDYGKQLSKGIDHGGAMRGGMPAKRAPNAGLNAALLAGLKEQPKAKSSRGLGLFKDPLEKSKPSQSSDDDAALTVEQTKARRAQLAMELKAKGAGGGGGGANWLTGGSMKKPTAAQTAAASAMKKKKDIDMELSESSDSDAMQPVRLPPPTQKKTISFKKPKTPAPLSPGRGGFYKSSPEEDPTGAARPGTAIQLRDDDEPSDSDVSSSVASQPIQKKHTFDEALKDRPGTSKAMKGTAARRLANKGKQTNVLNMDDEPSDSDASSLGGAVVKVGGGGTKAPAAKGLVSMGNAKPAANFHSRDDEPSDSDASSLGGAVVKKGGKGPAAQGLANMANAKPAANVLSMDDEPSDSDASATDSDYPDRPPSPGVVKPMPQAPPPPKPTITPSSSAQKSAPAPSKGPTPSLNQGAGQGLFNQMGGAGAQGRVNKAGQPLNDITPDSSEAEESDSSAGSSTLSSRSDLQVRKNLFGQNKPPHTQKPQAQPSTQKRVAKTGIELPDITPDSSVAGSESDGSDSTRGSSLDWRQDIKQQPAKGPARPQSAAPMRFSKTGAELPDITPDSSVAGESDDDSSDASSTFSLIKTTGKQPSYKSLLKRQQSMKGSGRVDKFGNPLADISPDSSVADDSSSQGDPEEGHDNHDAMSAMSSARSGGDPFFAGDSARGEKVTDAEIDNWLPLSSRLEGPDVQNFRWEDFNLAGLPKAAIDMGGRKAWLRYKTEAEFRKALRKNPNDLPTLHRYALLLYNRKKDVATAETIFQRCIALSPDYTEALLDYGCMCWNRYRMADKDRKDPADLLKAERMIRKAVQIVQSANLVHPRAFSKLALFIDQMLHDKEQALPWFKLAADSDPKNADHAYNHATHLEDMKHYDRAAKEYKRAIENNVLHASALSNYARLLDQHYHDRESAKGFHARAVKASPYDPDICYNFAVFQEEGPEDRKRDYAYSKDFFDRAVSGKPKDPNIYLTAAQFYLKRKRDFGRCMDLHKLALKQDPDHIPTLVSYGRFLEYDRKDLKNAGKFYERAMAVEGLPAEEAEALGEGARFLNERAGMPEKAAEVFRRAIERNPENAQVLSQAASFFKKVEHDDDGAKMVYENALEQIPEESRKERYEVLLAYGRFLTEECEEHEEAGGKLRECIKLLSTDSRAIGLYAILLHEFYKDMGLSDKYFRQAIKIDPTNTEAILGYAKFQESGRKNPGMAEHYYQLALKVDSSSGDSMQAYAQFLRYKKKDYPKALEFYTKAVERQYEDAELHMDFAEFLMECYPEYREMNGGDFKTAARIAEEQFVLAIECNPREPTYYTALAMFLCGQKRVKEAFKLFQQALGMDEDNPEVLGQYASFLEEYKKDYSGAEQMFLRAIKADKRNAVYLYNFAVFLEEKRKDYDRADDYYQRALAVSPKDKDINFSYAEFLRTRRKNKKLAANYYGRAQGDFSKGGGPEENKAVNQSSSSSGSSGSSSGSDDDESDDDSASVAESESSAATSRSSQSDATSRSSQSDASASSKSSRSSIFSRSTASSGSDKRTGNKRAQLEKMIKQARKEGGKPPGADDKDCVIS